MAAKPPKPPGKLLSERNNNNNNNNNSNNTNALVNVGESERSNNNNASNYVNNYQNNYNNNSDLLNSTPRGTNQTPLSIDALLCGAETPPAQTTPQPEQPQPTPPPPPPTCNCTNISIMHLFHEMKQEFPTIPDTIVAQCVNENCHQRDHCIEVLRNELILNPMPAQTYPAKQLIQQQLRHQQQQQQQQRNAPATPPSAGKPVKPLKPTRVAPSPLHAVKPTLTANACDNVTSKNLQKPPSKDVNCDMSASPHRQHHHHQQQQQHPLPQQQHEPAAAPPAVRPNRPTTLDLVRSKEQKEQRKQLNIELQRHLQQRQHRQQTPTSAGGSPTPLNRPSRRAPLPPLPPKPHSPHPTTAYSPHANHAAATANGHASGSSATTSPISPISSCGGESEISVNVSLSSPTSNVAAAKNLPLKTPLRHRSVITLQPEPPYAKQLAAAANTAAASGPKSFTSLNLTLRQPNPAVPPSTIDISAGPSPSGAGSGLTYSSTTYDSRSGCQKNFHITVTDQVGAFSASRISPHSLAHQTTGDQQSAQVQLHQYVSRPMSQQELLEQQRLEREEQLQQQQNATAARFASYDEMCYTADYDAATLQRQKFKRDKLASALRDNKKRLSQMKNEIVVLTQPITPGLPERLDSEINKLLEDCRAMSQRTDSGSQSGPSEMNEPHSQTFPGQRSPATGHPPYSNGSGGGYGSTTSASSSATTPTNNSTQHVRFPPHTDDDSDVQGDVYDEPEDDGDDEEEKWSCSMCTFQNHPLLNICEQCDNVRILPGTVRIVAGQGASGGPDAAAADALQKPTPTNGRPHGMPSSPGLHSMVAATTASIGAIAAPSAMLTTEQS